jgi:hypothetical protein
VRSAVPLVPVIRRVPHEPGVAVPVGSVGFANQNVTTAGGEGRHAVVIKGSVCFLGRKAVLQIDTARTRKRGKRD